MVLFPKGQDVLVVTCYTCNRTFDIDERRVADRVGARCLCGARVMFRDSALSVGGSATRLGKYLLLRRIAVGGMGEVYYGKIAGVEGFEREVAIKKMLPHLSQDRNFIDMMVKEAKLTVLLHHPNIVQVYDLGKEGNDIFIAMEYVPGITVGQLLEHSHRSGTLIPPEAAVHITMQVLRGLAYAHELSGPDGVPMHVLHRDITPQNILVTRNAWVKITDFGIAKARNEISTTTPGIIRGKLGYTAPEQLGGGKPDERVDIFCAGILLWESLAARRLFKGADEVDSFRLVSECKIPPLADYRNDVPKEIEAALQGALTKLPDDRYSSADEFYDALNQAIFPGTADDYQSTARRYFDNHPELFEGIATLATGSDRFNESTVELPPPSLAPEELAVISDFLVKEKPARRGARWAAIAAAFVFVIGMAAVGFVIRDRLVGASVNGTTVGRGTPVKLTEEDVQLAVNGERTRFLDCYASGKKWFKKLPSIKARLVVASTGGVAQTETQPPLQKLGAPGRCIGDILRGLKFPPHRDKLVDVTVDLPAPRDARINVAGNPPRNGGRSGGSDTAGRAAPNGGELTKEKIQSTLQQNLGPISRCLNDLARIANAPKSFTATITISTSGRITQVNISPAVPVPSVEQCLRKRLRSVRFQARPSTNIQVKIPLNIQVI